jgi:hypothetical protein
MYFLSIKSKFRYTEGTTKDVQIKEDEGMDNDVVEAKVEGS